MATEEPDTEHANCDFCGDLTDVAVSEQGPTGKARICYSCITWASEQLDAARPKTGELRPCQHRADDGTHCDLDADHAGRHEFSGPCKACGLNSAGKMRRCRLNAGHSGQHEPYE